MKKINPGRKSYMCMYPRNPEGKPVVNLDNLHSPLKILAQADMIRKFVKGENIFPIHMRMGITSSCNMRCNFCNFHSPNESVFYDCFNFNDQLTTPETISFLMDFAKNGGKAITFCGSGECTIHPGYVDICWEANRMGLRIGLITNGTMLHKRGIAQCIAQTHTWVRIGMNAGTAQSFNRITHYKPDGFMEIFQSIRFLTENAVEPDFRIGVNFVITMENYREMVLAASLAREANAHYIRFEPEFYTALGHVTIEDGLADIEVYLKEAKKIATGDFQVSVPKLNRGKMVKTDEVEGDFKKCHLSKFATALGADGYIYPCPQVHLGSKFRMGNPMKKGYDAWLKSGETEAWEKANPNREDLCKTCFYRPQNELLEWALNGKIDIEQIIADYNEDFPEAIHALFI